ncbi:MAG: tape measure protein [Chthoniobacteraceae bacterium]|jgi:hypothetical protein
MNRKTKLAAILYVGAEMGSSVKTVFGGMTKQINSLGRSMESLRSKESLAYKAMDQEGVVKREEAQLNKLIAAQKRAQIEADKSTAGKTEQANLSRTTAAVEKQTAAYDREMAALWKLDEQLKVNGIDSDKLDAETQRLGSAIVDMDRRMSVGGHLKKLGGAISGVGSALSGLAMQAGIVGGTVGYLFKSQFLDTAAQFETLKVRMGSASKSAAEAQASFDWVKNFAPNAPYRVEELTDAFINLKVRGIDPIKGGVFQTIGDTASALGADLNSVVLAFAGAEAGLNRRLQVLGIQTRKGRGNEEIWSYAAKNGKQMQVTVDKTNRAMIQSTLQAIFNQKYAGAMQKRMTTWDGMVTNLSDRWDLFKFDIMDSGGGGLFDLMKDKLGSLLSWLTVQTKNGNMTKWAKDIGADFKTAAEDIWGFGKKAVAVWEWFDDVAKPVLGDFASLRVAGVALGAMEFGPLILAVTQLGIALGGVGKAAIVGMGPLGWAISLAVVGVTALGIEIYKNWDMIKSDSIAAGALLGSVFKEAFIVIYVAGKSVFDLFAGFFTGDFSEFKQDIDDLENHFLKAIHEIGSAWSNINGVVNDGLLHPVTSMGPASASDVWKGSKAGRAGAPMPRSGVLRGGNLPTIPAPGARTTNVTQNFHITVTSQPGQEAKTAAEAKARIEQQNVALANAALFD